MIVAFWLFLSGLYGWLRHKKGVRVTVNVSASDPARGWVLADTLYVFIYSGIFVMALSLARAGVTS